ncbi:MAG: hypothetical protein LBG90_01515 [Spirochaetaceae bacterium]|nr:hypothetical protein [Spirochaetaceae bacterium]
MPGRYGSQASAGKKLGIMPLAARGFAGQGQSRNRRTFTGAERTFQNRQIRIWQNIRFVIRVCYPIRFRMAM